MATHSDIKVVNPSLTSPFVEPYCKSGIENAFAKSRTIFPTHAMQSFQMSTEQLRSRIEQNEAAEDDGTLKRNGFYTPDDLETLGGDGVMSVCMDPSRKEEDRHEMIIYDHASEETEHLGYFPLHRFYSNFGFSDRFGCCMSSPGVLCNITPHGDFVVLLGPLRFAQSHSPQSDAPVLAIYQVSPAKCLYEQNCKKIPFLKCSPIGISVSPPGIQLGEYRVALVTENMEVRIWDARLRRGSSVVQLEAVSPCLFNRYNNRNPHESCVKFSPDGHLLSVMCFMNDEGKCACLILRASDLEVLCWMAADEIHTWLRWIFPMFSSCGTKVVLSSYSDSRNKYDMKMFELFFHKIPLRVQALKFLCRVVILGAVRPSVLKQLPLPNDLISYLMCRNTEKDPKVKECSPISLERTTTCKCNLM